MPPPTKWPEALYFRVVHPSVHPYVCPFVRTSRFHSRDISRITWYECTYGNDNDLIIIWGHEVKGHRAHRICKNRLFLHYLKNLLMDSYQTWYMYVSWGANDLIRFWGHEVKGHRAH